MRFSARQQHCLETMGIVPWVSKHESEVSLAAEVEASVVAPTEAMSERPPEAASRLGEWVLSRALSLIHYRGSEFPVLGAAEAPLLVIVEQSGSQPATAALEGDSARLFELMLRSIQLTARDTRQCIVSTEPLASPDIGVAGLACTPQTRAVLLLMNPWSHEITDTGVEQHKARLPGSELPLWRMAHPALLLEQPLLKRQSWQALKSLHAVLRGSDSS